MGRIRQMQSEAPPPPPQESTQLLDHSKEVRFPTYCRHVPPSPETTRKAQSLESLLDYSDGDHTNLLNQYRRSLINENIVIVEKTTSVSEDGDNNFTKKDSCITNGFVSNGCKACHQDKRCGYFTNCPGVLTRSKSLSNLLCSCNNSQSRTSKCCVDAQELPEPNTVRRVKDVFESLAMKLQESVKNEERSKLLKRRATLSESWFDKPTPTYDNVSAKWNFDDRQLVSSNERKNTKPNQSSDSGSVTSEFSPPSSPLTFRKAKQPISSKMSFSSNDDSAIASDLSSTLSTLSSSSPSCASSSAGDSRPSSPSSTLRLTFAQLRQHHESLSIHEKKAITSNEKNTSKYLSPNKLSGKYFYSSHNTSSSTLPEPRSTDCPPPPPRHNSPMISAENGSPTPKTNIIPTFHPRQRIPEPKSPLIETPEELLTSLTEIKPNPISRSRSFNMLEKIGQDSSQLPEWIQSIRDKFAKWEAVDSEFRKHWANKLNKKSEGLSLSEIEPTYHEKPNKETKQIEDNYKNIASAKIKTVMEVEQSSDMKIRFNGNIIDNKATKDKTLKMNNRTSSPAIDTDSDTEWFDSRSNVIKTMVVGVVRKQTKQWESNNNNVNNGLEARPMTKSFSCRDLRTAALKDEDQTTHVTGNGSPHQRLNCFDYSGGSILNNSVEDEEYDRYTTTSSDGDASSEYQYDSDGAISLTEGFLEQRSTVKPILNGIWLRNPIWHGSSYIVYDFRGQKHVTPHIRNVKR